MAEEDLIIPGLEKESHEKQMQVRVLTGQDLISCATWQTES